MDFFPIFAVAALFAVLGVWQAGWPAAAASTGQRWMFRDREPNWSDAYLGYIRFGGVVFCLLAIAATIFGGTLVFRSTLAERCQTELKPALDATRSQEGWTASSMQAFADEHELTLKTDTEKLELPDLPDFGAVYGLDTEAPAKPTPLVTTTYTFSTMGTAIVAGSVQTGGYDSSGTDLEEDSAVCMP
ncbi:hypothetical protein C5E06_07900 [Pseudoclavibacter sp. RFBI5]|uniref:hypothetical protein n=1 Tax=Pseudoclavibacter sp. RFBI5 TaxID=2080578 RepID=UPI000CE931F6|nr:hypothetical protein [Pseudoclavibacter sp. RFBI5]PPG02396.1 hypothetical protein C5E06_07900 [Pseudoclavibacter sp. RFBI5]